MKIAGRRQSKNIIDRTPIRNSFSIYADRMSEGTSNLNKRSLGKYLGNKNKAAQKRINTKTSRVKTK